MTVENKNYSKNDLEHVKFTQDSNAENSIVQTYATNQQSLNELTEKLSQELNFRIKVVCTLDAMLDELKKINTHLNLINESDL